MLQVGNLIEARNRLAEELTQLSSRLRESIEGAATDIDVNLRILRNIRSLAYEDTNQILHEALLLKAIHHLQDKYSQPIEWFWNPRQTGDSFEPDLQGKQSDTVLISAEATTSEDPQGLIDQRMKKTLKKLSAMPGDCFYFVESEPMKKRALTKISKAGYHIQVVLIAS